MLAICYVGANEIAKARAMFAAGQRLAQEYVKSRLEGTWAYTRPEDIKRVYRLQFLGHRVEPYAALGTG